MTPDDRRPDVDDDAPASPALLALAAALHDAAADPSRRTDVLLATPARLAAKLGRRLSSRERAWLDDVLESARAVCRGLNAAEEALATAGAGLGAARVGLLAVDRRGFVAHANDTAARLLPVTPGTRSDMIARAAAALGAPDVHGDAVFREPVSSTRILEFRRVSGSEPAGWACAVPALTLSVTVLDTSPSPNAATIAAALGVTPAEANLCAELVRGLTVAAAAARLGIRMPTARSQLRSVFAKTETRRQAELMALLACLPVDLD
jgi:DNA-binding CsgD family transcriptional regulator